MVTRLRSIPCTKEEVPIFLDPVSNRAGQVFNRAYLGSWNTMFMNSVGY
jgi:hypothetical protein